MIIFCCQSNVNISYTMMCQVFIWAAGGVIMNTHSVAAMAAVSHQHIAMIVAVLFMFSEIGGACGLTAASAIW
jgi:hypothetical protein